jgi:hypothetical protein
VLKAVSVETGGFVAIKQIDKEAVDDSQLPGVMVRYFSNTNIHLPPINVGHVERGRVTEAAQPP